MWKKYRESETGSLGGKRSGQIQVALVFPNHYRLGNANLGFQTVYRRLNLLGNINCERVFLPDKPLTHGQRIRTIESGRRLSGVDLIAFSISFENDYPHILTILQAAGLPLPAENRDFPHPLVIGGGMACSLNPEPIAPFFDAFLLGESEALLPSFINAFDKGLPREDLLVRLSRTVSGVYIPAFYHPVFGKDDKIHGYRIEKNAPSKICRRVVENIKDTSPAHSQILSATTPFSSPYLIEVGRGCPHGCRFCSSGFQSRPPRFHPFKSIADKIDDGKNGIKTAGLAHRIGLVGAAVSDFPELKAVCDYARKTDICLSFSSLRANALTPQLINEMYRNGVKTATIAPEAGSEHMRRVINKGIDESDILNAATTLVSGGIPNLKLYFMIGLPTEKSEDIQAIIDLVKKIKTVFLAAGRAKGRIGHLTVRINGFVPKPFTPFQWAPMNAVSTLRQKIKIIKKGLSGIPNVAVQAENPRQTYLQGVFSRGDRRVSKWLLAAHENGGNFKAAFGGSALNPDFFALRAREINERLPWDFIDTGLNRNFLILEYKRSLAGKASPPCPMTDCERCRRCGSDYQTGA